MSSALGSDLHRADDRVMLRRILQYSIGSLLFVAVLIAYCELGSVLRGLPPAGLRSSGPWALQVALPWIIIGIAMGALSSHVAGNRAATIRSGLWICAVVFGMAAFALLGETFVRALTGAPDVFAFVCERAPASIAVSSLLVAIYVGSRSRPRERETTPSSAVTAPEGQPGASAPLAPPPTPDVGEWLEVMTGTGRTTIRVEEIECLQAEQNYINVVHSSGRSYLLRKTMTAAEGSLDRARFLRVHRSTIVNCDMIKERRPGGVLLLRSGRTVTIGRAFRNQVAKRLAPR